MGVRVPVIEQKRVSRSVLGRGYALSGTSVTIDEAAAAFEAEVDSLIELAQSELRLERLAREIQSTSRRTNALEHIVLPRLIGERDYIEMALDERERADHFRLKRVKRMREKKAEEEALTITDLTV
jgi:V/A-type H+-transporting ATPase subunit D